MDLLIHTRVLGKRPGFPTPYYSQDPALALKLVKRMAGHCGICEWIAIEVTNGGLHRVGIANHGTHAPGGKWRHFALSSKLAHAICLSALRIFKVIPDEPEMPPFDRQDNS